MYKNKKKFVWTWVTLYVVNEVMKFQKQTLKFMIICKYKTSHWTDLDSYIYIVVTGNIRYNPSMGKVIALWNIFMTWCVNIIW